MLVPEKRLLYVHRAQPQFCSLCEDRAGIRFGLEMHVIHAGDLCFFLSEP